MWDGLNHRKFPRSALRCEIDVIPNAKGRRIHVQTQNVGIGGVCVILNRSLRRYSECGIRLEVDKAQPEIRCNGKVVWTVETRDVQSGKSHYDTGIEFIDLPAAGREQIVNHIAVRAAGNE